MHSFLSLLPPLAAILIALFFKQIYLALLSGVFLGCILLKSGVLQGLQAGVASIVDVFQSRYNTQVILFCCLIGALISLCESSGGVEGFVRFIQRKNLGKTKRSVGLLACLSGTLIFIESSITCLITGAIARPLCKKNGVSPEKLAYLCDSTSAPVCMLIPLNSWGAYVLGLLLAGGISEPLPVLIRSIPLNFYPIFALILAYAVATSRKTLFGSMREAEDRAEKGAAEDSLADSALNSAESDSALPDSKVHGGRVGSPWLFIVPVLSMLLSMPLGLWITGSQAKPDANGFFELIEAGSGATAVLWAVLIGISVSIAMILISKAIPSKAIPDLAVKGIADLVSMSILMILAFALCDVCKSLGTGPYLASILNHSLPAMLLPFVIFVLAAVISFSTGTSFGTFGLMIPLALPLQAVMPLPLLLSAVLSGGVFGDHCSPISDTTLVASISARCDLLSHIKTQMPYALLAAGFASVAFLLAGLLAWLL